MHNYHITHKAFLACTIIGSTPSVLGRLLCPSQQKSPSTKSGWSRYFLILWVSISVQKSRWVSLLFGAYMFVRWVSDVSSHFIVMVMALPGISSWVVIFHGVIRALFTIKATPALACGTLLGAEKNISRFFPKQWVMVSIIYWLRCVSCSARIAILFSNIICCAINAGRRH